MGIFFFFEKSNEKNDNFLFTFSVIPDSLPRLETRQLSLSPEKEIPPVSCLQVGGLSLQVLWRSFSICFVFLSVEILRGRWEKGDASWKVTPSWMMKDSSVWKPDVRFYRFNLQLQKSQTSLCPTVTKKVYESESYSETDDDVQATKQAGKNAVPAKPAASNKQDDKKGHKKSSANTNKGAKQASIMGFFQKKWWLGKQGETLGRRGELWKHVPDLS